MVPKAVPGTRDRDVSSNWRSILAALKWVGVILLSAATAAAAVWEYQRRTAVPPPVRSRFRRRRQGERFCRRPIVGVTPDQWRLPPRRMPSRWGQAPSGETWPSTSAPAAPCFSNSSWPAAVAMPVATGGALHVETEPSGQTITVDGVERGQSPITVSDLSEGDHTVVARGTAGTVRRSVAVKAGEAVSLVFSPTAPVIPAPGWLSVQSEMRLELRENGKLIGTTETEQLMLPAGTHDIELVNEAVGYRSSRQVEVAPGKTTTVAVELPFGTISINAQPWAEVWIAGERIGETPIANLSRRVGSYEIVFRHPQLGERRENVVVTLRQPVRLGVDMRGK